MENLLKKYISQNVQKELLEDVINKLQILKEKTDNLNRLFKNQKMALDLKTIEPFYNFLHAYHKICDMVNQTEFIKELETVSSGNEIEFWNSIFQYFEVSKIAESETVFLREMDFNDFKDLVSYTFNANILHESFLKDYKEWDSEKINITRRTINTFLYHIIDDFLDFDTSIYILDIKFQFSNEKYKYIWELCEKNKMYLMLKNITEQVDHLIYSDTCNR